MEPGRTRRPGPPNPASPPPLNVTAPLPPKHCVSLTVTAEAATWRAGAPLAIMPPAPPLPPVMTHRSITTDGHELTETPTSPEELRTPPVTLHDSIQSGPVTIWA